MATYKISDLGSAGFRVAATEGSGMLHMCGGLATEDDVERWVAAHKRATEAEDQTERRPSPMIYTPAAARITAGGCEKRERPPD